MAGLFQGRMSRQQTSLESRQTTGAASTPSPFRCLMRVRSRLKSGLENRIRYPSYFDASPSTLVPCWTRSMETPYAKASIMPSITKPWPGLFYPSRNPHTLAEYMRNKSELGVG
jgi:hypothetical protein